MGPASTSLKLVGSLAVVLLLLIGIALKAIRPSSPPATAFDRTVQLSNSAFLRFSGTRTDGPDSGDDWVVSYREGTAWERAGNWWGGDWNGGNDGNILACPVGPQVIVLQTNGPSVFVRTQTGWKGFLMSLPVPASADASYLGAQGTSLEDAEIRTILRQMSIPTGSGLIRPIVANFHPQTRELSLDYRTNEAVFQTRLALLPNGEKFRLVSIQKVPDTLHPEYPDVKDPLIDPACTAIQFTSGLRE